MFERALLNVLSRGMRTFFTAVVFVVGLMSGCASSPEHPAPMEVPPTDEFAGITLGALRAALEERFQDAEFKGDSLSWMGTYTGRAANIAMYFDDNDQLVSINVGFQSSYESMDTCGIDWAAIRADMNRFYGPSSSDNLAAYWTSDARAIQLSCDIGDGDEASLSVGFAAPRLD